MLLSYIELVELVEKGYITDVDSSLVNASSIDITLGETVMSEQSSGSVVSLGLRQPLKMDTHLMDDDEGFLLLPGAFILAQSQQKFFLPNNISAEYKLKSSMARVGLEHLNSGWCDAGWHGSVLTMQMKNMTNHHSIRLRKGDKIGQIIFFKHTEVPEDASYAHRGSYNNKTLVHGAAPERMTGT